MNIEQFYQARKSDWDALTQLLDRSQYGLHKLRPEEIQSIGLLYRSVTSDLALAQRDFPEHRVTLYLNQLVARAHAVIYRSEPFAISRLGGFFTRDLPRLYREASPFILLAALLFLLPATIAGLTTSRDPEAARWVLPPQVQRLEETIQKKELWTSIPIEERPYAASFIMRNNIQVAILAFGSGTLVGLPTVWFMALNGLILGGITGLTAHYGIGFELWTFVIGHGVLELSVIFISGGAGLMLGWAILHPGLLRRRDALALAARKAVRLTVGCLPLLIVAGLVEGLISPAENIPWQVKWAIGLGSGLLLYGYMLLAGREPGALTTTSAP